MHRILSGRAGNSRSFGKSSSRPNFLANLVAVTNIPSDIKPHSSSNSTGTSSEELDQDGKHGASSGSSGSSSATRPDTNQLISFYTHSNGGRDSEGRTLSEILRFPDHELEHHHDYIQWLFPLPERSPFNPDAPQINQAIAEAFRTRLELRNRLRESLVRMLSFYGFEVNPNSAGEKFEIQERTDIDFHRKSRFWLRQFDHNHLRITRIIRSLRVLGLEDEGKEFYKALARVAAPRPGLNGGVSQRTLTFWRRAAKRPLQVPPEDEDYPDPEEEEEEE